MSGTLNDSRQTAVHEAGHAVIGRKLGLNMGQASAACDAFSADQPEPAPSRPETVCRALEDHLRAKGYLPAVPDTGAAI